MRLLIPTRASIPPTTRHTSSATKPLPTPPSFIHYIAHYLTLPHPRLLLHIYTSRLARPSFSLTLRHVSQLKSTSRLISQAHRAFASRFSPTMDRQFLPFDPYEPQIPQPPAARDASADGEEADTSSAFASLNINTNAASTLSSSGPRRVSPKRSIVGLRKDKGADKPKDMRKSCAECRRLKAKCDRVFPCSNCRRRGCALVCPDGDLSCMQGKRLVLASTEQLHDRVSLSNGQVSSFSPDCTTRSRSLPVPHQAGGRTSSAARARVP